MESAYGALIFCYIYKFTILLLICLNGRQNKIVVWSVDQWARKYVPLLLVPFVNSHPRNFVYGPFFQWNYSHHCI